MKLLTQNLIPLSSPENTVCAASLAATLFLSVLPVWADSPAVDFLRVPENGIQPQAVIDSQGSLHLIYFKGDPMAGDIFYVRQAPGSQEFSKPIQVNAQPGSAIAAGTIRGAHLAVGKNSRVHVAWNGSGRSVSPAHKGAPMLYTRLQNNGAAFEPERDLIQYAAGLDGGGSVAADAEGNVYVIWHANTPGNKQGEAGRAVFVARSRDEGKTFPRERQASPKPTGACGCCGLRAFADSQGRVYILYRGATEKVNRDEILLISKDHGESFEIAHTHPWKTPTCPMSSASLTEGQDAAFASWETEAQVYGALIDSKQLRVTAVFSPPGMGKRKHPAAVSNAKGEVLLVWTDGTGWQKGGSLVWQFLDRRGRPTSEQETRNAAIPVWSFAAAVAKPDGKFAIIY